MRPHTPFVAPGTLDEYAIFLLKPDAYERGLERDLRERVVRDGLRVVATRPIQLAAADIHACFLHPLPEIIDYLTSRPVELFLVLGPDAHLRLYRLKHQIRREHGLSRSRRNLLHAADHGNEYHLMLERFLREQADPDHANAVDLDLRFLPGVPVATAVDSLAELDRNSALRWCSITIPRATSAGWAVALRDAIAVRPWRQLQFAYGIEVAPPDAPRGSALLVAAAPRELEPDAVEALRQVSSLARLADALAARPRPATIVDLALSSAELERYAADVRWDHGDELEARIPGYPVFSEIRDLAAAGATGLMCHRPGFGLMEAEMRLDLARLAGLGECGGSAGRVRPGQFSVSHTCLGDRSDEP
jgi:nucleoside diphosphate kinase